MKIVADLHIHSRFARATSKNLNVDTLNEWAAKKGITIMGNKEEVRRARQEDIWQKRNNSCSHKSNKGDEAMLDWRNDIILYIHPSTLSDLFLLKVSF